MLFGLLMEGGKLMLILGMNGIEAMGLPDELGGNSWVFCDPLPTARCGDDYFDSTGTH